MTNTVVKTKHLFIEKQSSMLSTSAHYPIFQVSTYPNLFWCKTYNIKLAWANYYIPPLAGRYAFTSHLQALKCLTLQTNHTSLPSAHKNISLHKFFGEKEDLFTERYYCGIEPNHFSTKLEPNLCVNDRCCFLQFWIYKTRTEIIN